MINADVTLRRLIWELNEWATDHKMVNDFFGYGEFLQLSQESARDYPAIVVNCTASPSEQWYINYTLEVMALQNVPDEQPNRTRAMSDMRQILNDLEETITYSDRWQAFSKLPTGFNCVPAIEKGQDKGFGWIATFTIKIKKRHGICNLQALMPEYDFDTGNVIVPGCDPATYENSDGSFSQEIASGATFNSDDIVVTINGDAQPASKTNVNLAFIIPIVTPLNTANIFKTGATTSFRTNDDGDLEQGRGVDILTLGLNNGFGNTNRYTDDLGTQIYASLVIVDWSTWDQINNTVLCYYKTLNASASLNTQIDGQPYTKNSISNWFVCNWKELTNMFNLEIRRQYMNYTPFNHSVSATAERVWTSTMDSSTGGTFYSGTAMSVGGGTPAYRALLCRTYTLTELGL